METKINAHDIFFGDFRKASEVFYIPSLQRPYSWDAKKQVDRLWDDIIENDAPYYIGSIVFVVDGGSAGKDQIIDGEQRITTLYLMLVAIRDYALNIKTKDAKDMVREIDDLLIKYRADEKIIRLSFSNEGSNKVYEAIINSSKLVGFNSEIQKKFIKNYQHLSTRISEYCGKGKFSYKKLEEIFFKIKKLQLIFVECKNKSAAFRLFESINATGVDLSTNDLIKNAILESVYEDKKLLEQIELGWKSMTEEFNENSSLIKTYIRHHWISTVDYTNHSKLFDDFLSTYKTKNEIVQYAESLFSSASVYTSFRNGNVETLENLTRVRTELSEIKELLKFIASLGVDQVYPVLMRLYSNEPDKIKKDLIRLSAFLFIFKYIPGSPSFVEKKFANFCKGKLIKEKFMQDLIQICKNKEEDFVGKFNEKIKYIGGSSVDVQFILEKYLYFLGKPVKFADPSIEHIIPQDVTDSVYKKFKVNEKDAVKLVNKIGNLTILERSENSSTFTYNQEFEKKYPLYAEHLFDGNKNIVKFGFDVFPEKAIEDRGLEIASATYKIFMKALETGKWIKK